jgi:hypothetical protein
VAVSNERYEQYVAKKKENHLGWAAALIQTVPIPNKNWKSQAPEGAFDSFETKHDGPWRNLENKVAYDLLYTKYAECWDVVITRYPDGGGRVSVGRASADWVNEMSPGWVLMSPGGKVIESNGGFFEAER